MSSFETNIRINNIKKELSGLEARKDMLLLERDKLLARRERELEKERENKNTKENKEQGR